LEIFECEIMGWALFDDLARTVAKKIIDTGYNPDFIVGLARGGWVLSRVLCDYLGVNDLVSLKVEHWGVTASQDGSAQIKYPFNLDLKGRRVLIVDDITDTGDSLCLAMDYVTNLCPDELKTATLRYITGGKFIPDYYTDEITWRWVIFPWNYIEDMCYIVSKVAESDPTLKGIREQLKTDYKINMELDEITQIIDEVKRREKQPQVPSR